MAAALDWFEALGYTVLQGPDIAPGEPSAERSDFGEVVLGDRLRAALERLNANVPESALDEALRKVTRTETPSLVENNRRFHRLLTDGVDVEYRRAGRLDRRRQGLAVRLRTPGATTTGWSSTSSPSSRTGTTAAPTWSCSSTACPWPCIELKNPGDENATIKGAFNQLQTYKKDIPGLFAFNEMLVISDGLDARVGTITADWERFMPWRTIDGVDVAPPAHARARSPAQGDLRPRAVPRPGPALRRLRGGRADRPQEAGRLSPVPRRQQGRRLHGPRRLAPRATSGSASSGTPRDRARA